MVADDDRAFVMSADGLLGKEAKALVEKLSALLAEKWETPHSKKVRRQMRPFPSGR
jgi:hypothetical protein